MIMPVHEKYMQRCLDLASLGLGDVQPNPMVGAVIVVNDTIVGEGYHRRYGGAHAEIEAIRSVKEVDLLRDATLYVNLEPCSHFGKTPPCADAIIAHQIPRVVIGNKDPHDKVNGNGIRKLQDAGIEVVTAVLEEEGKNLNKRFFTYHLKKRPYIILKWARTKNGFMDIERVPGQGRQDYWITNSELKTIVHKWRSEEDAILIGYRTLANDRPLLTTRHFPGKSPRRFVMTKEKLSPADQATYQSLPENIEEALHLLYEQKITSVIVEGGRKTIDRFLQADLWDEARILTGNQQWESGMPAPCLDIMPYQEVAILDNTIRYVRRHV